MRLERISMWAALLTTLATLAYAMGNRTTRLDVTEAAVKELTTEVKELRNDLSEIRGLLRTEWRRSGSK